MKFRSTLLGQASGSLAGTTFSRNRGGAYTRSRAVPVNPNSVAQQAVRAYFAAAAANWRTLTGAQRTAWDDYAAGTPRTNPMGDTIYLTGAQWYIGMSVLASRIAGAFTSASAAPVTPGLLTDVVTGVALSVATGATLTYPAIDSNAALVRVGAPVSAGVSNVKQPVSVMSEVDADPSGAILLNRAGYPYGALVAGQRRVVEATLFAAGTNRASAAFRAIVTVAA